jgi:antitoxin ParD1/3/4
MAKISISMSDQMEEFVAERIESGDFNNTSEYFRDLVRRDQQKLAAEDKLRTMIREARASGVSEETFDQIWDRALDEHRRKRRGK